MSGRVTIAPCGHTGEVIIGTYIKCLLGCDGPAAISARGEPGHVANCTCKPCQIRRKATVILLRTSDGKDVAIIPWDGTSTKLRVLANQSGFIASYKFLDADGKPVATGNIDDVYVIAGGYMNVDIKTFVDHAARNSTGFVSHTSIEFEKPEVKKFDPNKVVVTFRGQVITGSQTTWIIDPPDDTVKVCVVKDVCPAAPTQIHDLICKLSAQIK